MVRDGHCGGGSETDGQQGCVGVIAGASVGWATAFIFHMSYIRIIPRIVAACMTHIHFAGGRLALQNNQRRKKIRRTYIILKYTVEYKHKHRMYRNVQMCVCVLSQQRNYCGLSVFGTGTSRIGYTLYFRRIRIRGVNIFGTLTGGNVM